MSGISTASPGPTNNSAATAMPWVSPATTAGSEISFPTSEGFLASISFFQASRSAGEPAVGA